MPMEVRIVSPHEVPTQLIIEELRPHFGVEHEISASGRYVLRVQPGADVSAFLACLDPLAPPVEIVPELDVAFELHLDDLSPFSRWNVSVRGDHPETLTRGDELVGDLGLTKHLFGHQVQRDHHLERPLLTFGGAPAVVRDLIRWRAARLGLGVPTDKKEWSDEDRDVLLHLVDPELVRLPRRMRPTIDIACDDLHATAELVRRLETAGFRARHGLANSLKDFSLRGVAFVDDERGLDRSELRLIVGNFLADQGVARDSHPLIIDETPMRSSATGPMRIAMPLAAYRRGTLAPWHGDHPARFRIRLHTDRRAKLEGLSKRLRDAGFQKVSIVDRTRPEGEPIACLRTLREAPETLRILEEALASETAAGFVRPTLGGADATWELRHLPCHVDLHLPFEGARTDVVDAHARLLIGRHGQKIALVTEDGRSLPALAAALGEHGITVTTRRDTCVSDCIRCGGTPIEAIAAIQSIIKSAIGLDVPVDREWPVFLEDVWIMLGAATLARLSHGAAPESSDAATAASATPAVTWENWLEPAAPYAPRPFVEVTASAVRIGDTELARLVDGAADPALVPDLAPFALYCLDKTTAATLEHLARSVLRSEPCLLEGPTSTSKTSSILYLAALLGQPVVRLNLNGQTDTGELVGRYTPGPDGWAFRQGVIVRALREGWWVVLDELNLAEPQVLERLNPVLETPPSLVLTEHDDRIIGGRGAPVHPRFRIFGTMNPAEYAGRTAMSPAWRDRWLACRHASAPTEGDYLNLLIFLASGAHPNVRLDGVQWLGERAVAPYPKLAEAFASDPSVGHRLQQLARFHTGLEAAATGQTQALGSGRKERYVFTRRGLLAVVEDLERALGSGRPFVPALCAAIDRYYLQRLAPGEDRDIAQRLLAANGFGPPPATRVPAKTAPERAKPTPRLPSAARKGLPAFLTGRPRVVDLETFEEAVADFDPSEDIATQLAERESRRDPCADPERQPE